MQTFTAPRELVANPRFSRDRQAALAVLDLDAIDAPIVDLIAGFAALPHCFTLQSCYGHFVCQPEQDPHNCEPLPPGHSGAVRYRIAYVAFCVENSRRGRGLRQVLARVPDVAPGDVQFGSADWFWERCPNSYVLQVEPVAHQFEDEAVLEPHEARRVQTARELVFRELRALLVAETAAHAPGEGRAAVDAAARRRQ